MTVTEGVVLAAGYASRAGANKLLFRLGEKTVIERCIESLYEACPHIIVVGGHYYHEIKPILKKYTKVQLVYHKRYKDGMFSSIKKGVKYVKGDRFFIMPGDYPVIQKSTIEKMKKIDAPIVMPRYQGILGHPVLIKSCFIRDILKSELESLERFLHSKKTEVDDIGVITDIDTMEDYHRIKL